MLVKAFRFSDYAATSARGGEFEKIFEEQRLELRKTHSGLP